MDLLEHEVAILGSDTEDLMMCLVAFGELRGRDRSKATLHGSRRHLVILLEMMAILCKFRHNRRILRNSLGSSFARLLVSLLLALSRRGDKLSQEWSQAVEEPQAMADETRFILACLYQCVQLVDYCIPSYPLYCFLVEERSVLPKHPWTAPSLARYCGQSSDGSGRGKQFEDCVAFLLRYSF